IYEGVVDKVMSYGVFINVSNNITGLCHLSEIFKERVNVDMEKIFNEGDIVKVKVISIENGKTNFSMKDIEQDPSIQQKIDNPQDYPAPEFKREDRRDDRGDRRGSFNRDRGERRFKRSRF
ncbi:partial DNA-directed RNA polymerase subunit E', partial [Patescibacteria group bacterium]